MKLVYSLIALSLLAACGSQPEPENLSMFRRYSMMDQNGNFVGTVTLKPVGHGEMHDANGQLIGIVTNP